MMRTGAMGALLALMLACTPVDGTEKEEGPGMRLELKTITAFTQDAEGQSLTLGFDGRDPVIMPDGEAGLDIVRDLPWLSGAVERGVPVAVNSATGQVLPATVAMELAWGHDGPNADGNYVVFGPPRPGAMYLKPDMEGADAMLDTIRQVIAEDQGAAFALRDAVWIEDIRPVEPGLAMRLLGFGGQ